MKILNGKILNGKILNGRAGGWVREAARRLAAPLDPTLAACTWVPPAGAGVCASCHAACRVGRSRCRACALTAAQVGHPAPGVTPISLFRTGDGLWYLLRHYKDGATAAERRRCRRSLARLLTPFLRLHLGCAAPGLGDEWVLTAVPSTHRRRDRFPLERVIRSSPWLRRRYRRTLRCALAPAHHRADDAAFAVVGDVAGLEVVLVDDTYTTGASIQSAASALHRAGARVGGVIVIGRVVNPAIPAEAGLWAEAAGRSFRLERCCQCRASSPARASSRAPRRPAGKLVGIS